MSSLTFWDGLWLGLGLGIAIGFVTCAIALAAG